MSAASPAEWHARAKAAGDPAAARKILEAAMKEHPGNAALANSAGHLEMTAGNAAEAERLFARASQYNPDALEYALNQAIALARLERHGEALALLGRHEAAGAREPRYCSARAASERALGNPAAAARWYDACLTLSPNYARALQGRAHIALESGEANAVARFEAALAANQQDHEAWLGLAKAYDAGGDHAQARALAEQLAAQAPHWVDVLRFLAQLRLAAGEANFALPFAEAERRLPGDRAVSMAHIEVLAGLDLGAQAAEVAARGRARFGGDTVFGLLEAINSGVAGDDARAEAIFATIELDTGPRWMHEARHRIRLDQLDLAETALDQAANHMPWEIGVWALRGIVWRLRDDPRAKWLHGQDGLYRLHPLGNATDVLAAARPVLERLHDVSAMPLGQSLRGGTQTRGQLFDRTEPELAQLHSALLAAMEDYRESLPPADLTHPLLRHRDSAWRIGGSWSVRLGEGGDYHTAHIHSQGIISSALYCALPEGLGGDCGQDGWLELGRPAPDLRLDLPPLAVFRPIVGHLALFPSTLYHGTRPFSRGHRMTVAFDVALREPLAG